MPDVGVQSQVDYSDAVIEQASVSFVRYFFGTRRGRLLMIASVVNIAGLGLIIYLGVREAFMLMVVGMIAALGPVYLAFLRFGFPKRTAAVLKQHLKPRATVTVSSSGFGIATHDRAIALPWTEVKAVREFPEYFLLVFAHLAYTVIPKEGLPEVSRQLIRQARGSNAA
jgi:hypothetical protein